MTIGIFKLSGNFEDFIERLAKRLSAINILCVKIFQAISSNNSLIDEKINNKLIQYTDNAPWSNEDIDYKTMIVIGMLILGAISIIGMLV